MLLKTLLSLAAVSTHRTSFAPAYRSSSLRCLSSSGAEGASYRRKCNSPEDVEAVGEELADLLSPGDVLLLQGDLGAGKTTLSRGIIRAKFGDSSMAVTSPSYLLDNTYQYGESEFIHHMDLYRLPQGCDMGILGIPEIFSSALCIIEWPDRMSVPPPAYLELTLSIADSQQRTIRARPVGEGWAVRAEALRGVFGEEG
ncbi:hypothetical protein B484DRAFT_409410 [Ochromonadaceae sp. CCMP2298]|nr:hypothetical protein B484DRAFT_409410 [Ochromonadaceae sp. CCMP2298]